MGYGVYRDFDTSGRWAGYMVPAECDWTDCHNRIDRGLGYKCEDHGHFAEPDEEGNEPWVASEGCGLYFCETHRWATDQHDKVEPKPDLPEWLRWMLIDGSWSEWRNTYPSEVRRAQRQLASR